MPVHRRTIPVHLKNAWQGSQNINFGEMKRRWQIFWHALFWAVTISFFMFFARNNMKLSTGALLVIFLLFPLINISLFYLNYLLLIPQFLNKKRYGIYAVAIVVAVILYGFFKYGVALIFKQYVTDAC